MIIDGHVHIGTSTFFHLQADADLLLAAADAAGIDKLFVTHTTALLYDMRAGNDALAAQIAPHRDRMFGYTSIPTPRFGTAAQDELRRCFETHGFRGLKIYSQPEASIAEPQSYELLATAAELGVPVLAHTSPAECDHLMTAVPEVRLVMAHMGGHPYAHGDWHRAVAVAERPPRLLLDTASSVIDNGMLEHAVAQIGAEKILFGTDMPLLDPHTQLAKVRGAALTDADKAAILGGNLARILGLT